jgi:hypothetical protein
MSEIYPEAPSPLHILAKRNQKVSSPVTGVARHAISTTNLVISTEEAGGDKERQEDNGNSFIRKVRGDFILNRAMNIHKN